VAAQVRVSFDIRDPFSFDLRIVRQVLELKDHDPLVAATEIDEEQHTGRFVFQGGDWPDERRGETALAVEFRDRWKRVEFLHAAEWLAQRPPSVPDRLRQQELESYLVLEGYHGIIPQDLLKEVVRLGCALEIR